MAPDFLLQQGQFPTCKRGCLTFKEQYDLFVSAGCSVVGIGRDSVDSHRTFKEGSPAVCRSRFVGPDASSPPRSTSPCTWAASRPSPPFLIGPDDTVHYVYDWLFRPAGTWLASLATSPASRAVRPDVERTLLEAGLTEREVRSIMVLEATPR